MVDGGAGVPSLEAEPRGGEPRRDVEEVAGGDEALEPREGLVRAARRRESPRRQVVETTLGIPFRPLALEADEERESLVPPLLPRRLRDRRLERRVGRGRRQRQGGEEGEGDEEQPAGH